MLIKNYKLENDDKVQRAIEKVGDNEDAILVEYDKLGGLITQDGVKIKTGSFYDIKGKKAFAEPKVEVEVVKPKSRQTVETVIEGKPEKKRKAK